MAGLSEVELIKEIEAKRAKYNYLLWTIGITNDPQRRKKEHESEGESTGLWVHWKAENSATAKKVEKHFLDKGMKGGTGGGERSDPPDYVYIF